MGETKIRIKAAFEVAAICGLLVVFGASSAVAAEPPGIGTATIVRGKVTVKQGEGAWKPVSPGDLVYLGDRLRTAAQAELRITLEDASLISLSPRSEIELNEFVYRPGTQRKSHFKLWSGRMKAKVSQFMSRNSSVEIGTPTAVAGVRGTEFVVNIEKPEADEEAPATRVVVLSGKVSVRNAGRGIPGELVLGQGQQSAIKVNAGPAGASELSPEELRELASVTEVKSLSRPRSGLGKSHFDSAKARVATVRPAPLLSGGSAGASDAPPISQQATDALRPPTVTIRIELPVVGR